MPATATKSLRTEARLRPDQKQRIEDAASLRGQSMSDFMVQHSDQAAKEILQQEREWKLSEADTRVFVAALLNPPEPTASMKAAAARYKRELSRL